MANGTPSKDTSNQKVSSTQVKKPSVVNGKCAACPFNDDLIHKTIVL